MQLACMIIMMSLSLVYGNDVMGPPVISKDIMTETQPVGSTGMLNCTVANLGTNKVFWNRDAVPEKKPLELITMGLDIKIQNPKDEHGIKKYDVLVTQSPNKDELTYTLVIRSLVQDDDGTYTCSIMVQGDTDSTWPHRTGILYVQRPPEILKAQSTSTVTTSVGENVNLVCQAAGRPEPNITWSRNRGTLKDPRDGEQVLRVMNSTYAIYNVTAADRGMYRCMADNNVKPPAIYMVTLLVSYKPVIRAFRHHVGQAPDRNLEAEMACKVMGYPDPEVSWWRQEGEKWVQINDDAYRDIDKLYGHGPNLDVTGSWTALRIRNVKMGDYGLYKCKGENIYGESEEFIKFFMTTTCQGANCRLGFAVRDSARPLVPTSVLSLILWTFLQVTIH